MSVLARVLAIHRVEYGLWMGRPAIALATRAVDCAIELLGSLLVGVVGYTACAVATTALPIERTYAFALGQLLAHMVVAVAVRWSSGDFNTALTTAQLFTGFYSLPKWLACVVGQFGGFSLAALFVRYALGSTAAAEALAAPTVGHGRQLLYEWMLITLFMMAAHVFARQLDRRTPSGRRMPDGVASIGVGTALLLTTTASLSLGSGGAINFMRAAGISLVLDSKSSALGWYALATVCAAATLVLLDWALEWFAAVVALADQLQAAAVADADAAYCMAPAAAAADLCRDSPVLSEELTLVLTDGTTADATARFSTL